MPGVAIVGSRDTSPAGEEITRRITNQIVAAGFIIVSGLAIGTDANAHKAALQAKGKTIAVLAHGLEKAKPKQNSRLAQEILEKGEHGFLNILLDARLKSSLLFKGIEYR